MHNGVLVPSWARRRRRKLHRTSVHSAVCIGDNGRYYLALMAHQMKPGAQLVPSWWLSVGAMLKPLYSEHLVMLLAPRCLDFYGSPLSLAD
jgi:hypothetical protein